MKSKQIKMIFQDVCDFFNSNSVMTQQDFNDLCDFYHRQNIKEDLKKEERINKKEIEEERKEKILNKEDRDLF